MALEVPPVRHDLLHLVSTIAERREARRLLERRVTFDARKPDLKDRPHGGDSHCSREPDVYTSECGPARRLVTDRTGELLERRTAKHRREVGHLC